MKFVPYKFQIPRSFAKHPHALGLVAEADIFPKEHGRLAAKLLIFKSLSSLRFFWEKGLGAEDFGNRCLGVVNALAATVTDCSKYRSTSTVLKGDRRYFCLIGLCVKYLSMEVITHESVHAAFCYEKRVKRNLFGPAAQFDEERIAYPTGIIAASIRDFLNSKDLLK